MCLPIIGGIVSGLGSAMGALSSKASHNANAANLKKQAELERLTSNYQGARKKEEVERVIGSQRAGYASAGIALTGSAADVMEESASEGDLDIQAIRWNSSNREENLKYQAKIEQMNAKNAGRAAPLAFLAPVISGVAEYRSSFG